MSAHENSTSFDDRPPPSLRSFGLTFAAVFALIAVWPLLWQSGGLRLWAAALAAVFLALTFVAPQVLAPLNKLWFGFGLLLHKVVNPLILGLMFVVLLTPLALLMRMFGKRFLPTGFDASATSYWVTRDPPGPDPQSIRNQF